LSNSALITTDTENASSVAALSDLAREIRTLAGAIRASTIEIGARLIVAKCQLEHGAWLSWLAAEFGWNARTAQNLMRVAEAFGKYEPDSHLRLTIDASALYALASRRVPEDVRDQAVAAAKAGTHVTKRVALRPIEAAKPTAEPAPAEGAAPEAIDAAEDDDGPIGATEDDDDLIDDDPIADRIFNRPPIPNDEHWQENVRDWIDHRRDEPILLKDVINRFVDTLPLHHATRRWRFDFDELADSAFTMRAYALLISLRSLGVKFNPPLGRSLYPAPETEFTVPRRRRSR
jgi:hypothetical protein